MRRSAVPEEIDFPWLENASFEFGDFVPVFKNAARVGQTNNDTDEANEVTVAGNEASDLSDPTSSDSASPLEDCTEAYMLKIFSCPEEGCIKYFVRYSSLQKLCIFGAYKIVGKNYFARQGKIVVWTASRRGPNQTPFLCSGTR